jgi:hypothetical protein
MKNQYAGTVETESGTARTLVCRDNDRPNEVMIHIWNTSAKPFAILVSVENVDRSGDKIRLLPTRLYGVDDSGGLYAVPFSNPEAENLSEYSAILTRYNTGWVGQWSKRSGESGKIMLYPVIDNAEIIPQECGSWAEFKLWADSIRRAQKVEAFRGHGDKTFRLKTSMHRAGRYRLERYCSETLLEFCGHLEAVEGIRANLSNGDDYSMLLGMAQHHGLPTPLLDWTRSPYVAAFFAFADALEWKDSRDATHVRIYGLSQQFFNTQSKPVVKLPYIKPYVTPLRIGPLRNQRLYVQQGLFIVSNAANIEHILLAGGELDGVDYLVAADIPISCAAEALEDLKFMGLTAGTMFPGLDGVCRMMKHAMYSTSTNASSSIEQISTVQEVEPHTSGDRLR